MHLRSATMLSQQQQAGVLATIEPPRFPLTVVKQYCETLWLNHGKIHGQANSTVRPLLAEHNPLPPRRNLDTQLIWLKVEDGRSALGANVAFLQLRFVWPNARLGWFSQNGPLGFGWPKRARLVFPIGLPLMGKG